MPNSRNKLSSKRINFSESLCCVVFWCRIRAVLENYCQMKHLLLLLYGDWVQFSCVSVKCIQLYNGPENKFKEIKFNKNSITKKVCMFNKLIKNTCCALASTCVKNQFVFDWYTFSKVNLNLNKLFFFRKPFSRITSYGSCSIWGQKKIQSIKLYLFELRSNINLFYLHWHMFVVINKC